MNETWQKKINFTKLGNHYVFDEMPNTLVILLFPL